MTALITDSLFKNHLTGAGHPECPARLGAILKALEGIPLPIFPARDASKEDLLRCHTEVYIQTAISDIKLKKRELSTGDVALSKNSLKAAIRAAGAVLCGIDAIIEGKVKQVFCAIRPPGHHAESNKGMGFCLFNNAAIGARYAQQVYGIKRVAIIDWDVHHGNGTQEIFENDPSVFYFSTHQANHYPGTGHSNEKGLGNIANCPILEGSDSRVNVIKAFNEVLVPAMKIFKPELVIVSAGFDAHIDDPLGNFNLTDADFAQLTEIVKQVAKQYAQGRIISLLEGGYNLTALASAVKAHILALNSN